MEGWDYSRCSETETVQVAASAMRRVEAAAMIAFAARFIRANCAWCANFLRLPKIRMKRDDSADAMAFTRQLWLFNMVTQRCRAAEAAEGGLHDGLEKGWLIFGGFGALCLGAAGQSHQMESSLMR